MLSGFNTNYRHRGVVFHVQTEDSGRANPHVISHLFHGGNIIKSEKVDYSAMLDAAELEVEVKALMERQHKKMLKALSRGLCDNAIRQRMGEDIFAAKLDGSDTIPPTSADATAVAAASKAEEVKAPAVPAASQSDVGRESTRDRIARAFGDGVVSEKPLDEVVLDYLVENARKRKRSTK